MSHSRFITRLFYSPARVIALSFAVVILLGTMLLMLPACARDGVSTPFLDCLFTATSATCVTGLIIYDTYWHWSALGHVVILSLIQIGGLGLVTFTSFVQILIGKKLGLRGRHLAQESTASLGEDVNQLLRVVIGTSLVVELAGLLLLATQLVPQYGAEGIFIAAFTSISAFCNAGFDLFGRQAPFISLCNYNANLILLVIVGLLILTGGIGFIVIHDLANYRKTRKLTLHTRVVLLTSLILMLLGMGMTALCEWDNPATLGALPDGMQRVGAAWFHSVSCRTAGFNSVPIDGMRPITKVFSSLLMFLGAAPGSTGGGIKCTTAAVIAMTVYSVIRGDEETLIFGRRVDKSAVYKSLAVMMLGVLAVSVTGGCILLTMEDAAAISGVDAVFESVSAFATVGLSAGISANANTPSLLLLILSMFIGRIGPVSFFLSMAMRTSVRRRVIVPEGKIQIG
ncbi:MAG: potassium transporter Trk [Anaerotruncus sp.]|nr:potassium transporter Trk [Anaerotruncus sp.]